MIRVYDLESDVFLLLKRFDRLCVYVDFWMVFTKLIFI
jgi:hypothetical protein